MAAWKESYYREKIDRLLLNGEKTRRIEFEECEFDRCSFVECTFEQCKFISCSFNDCIISAADISGSRFIEAAFNRSKVMGFNWVKATKIQDLSFTNCRMDYSNFKTLKLPNIRIVNCEAKDVTFTEAEMEGGVFTGTDFEGSIFFKTNLAGADFRGAKKYSIDVRNNHLHKTRFSSPEVLALLDSLDIIID